MEIALSEENFEKLYEDAGEALDYFPNQEQFLFFHGISASYTGKYPQAIRSLEKIKKINSGDNELLSQVCAELGTIYHRQGDFANSDLNFLKAIELTPEDPMILNNYAYYLSIRGDKLASARQYIEKALKISPGQPSYQDTYGWVLYQQGEYEKAADWIEKALAAGESAVILEHYGDALFKLGKRDEAVIQWKKAIEKGAKNLNIETKLQGQ
ncbi:MAG: tetratricopeptide repeat protein [Bacteroidia bacterium]